MRKSTKVVLLLVIFFLFFPLFHTLITTQYVAGWSFVLRPFTTYPLIGDAMGQFLFWSTAGLLILLIISIFVIIFFPKVSNELEINTENGTLTIQKKAIESYVLTAVKEEPFIANPSVKAVIKKKKIKIYVSGQMRKVFQTTQRQQALADKIKTDLNQLFGAKQEIVTDVIFKDFRDQKHENDEPRVL
ncbi:alkaline shock response membrane anchor protein AmaP [Enterococcus sp. SMC-9]|uniref:alkaline shock response membrane anchor protein AmaP n=1 Tax=Enterococcus sp. SMC-9 TaxID=2862343 RepID=UPI001E46A039|nr:alkaline shock response membrane anchor protein AmaP [Enterococcus sp. SMC-9]MCD1023895.1 alkaline shock response membrane anchor protein AmaP [Enterococcus sp. SMC-9]